MNKKEKKNTPHLQGEQNKLRFFFVLFQLSVQRKTTKINEAKKNCTRKTNDNKRAQNIEAKRNEHKKK